MERWFLLFSVTPIIDPINCDGFYIHWKNCLLKNYAAQHNNYILIDNTFFVLALPATFFCSLFRGAPCQNVKSQIQRMVKVIGSNFFDFFEMSDFDPCKKAAVMVKRRRRNRFWTCQSTLIRKSGSSSRVAVKLKAFSRGEFKIWTSFFWSKGYEVCYRVTAGSNCRYNYSVIYTRIIIEAYNYADSLLKAQYGIFYFVGLILSINRIEQKTEPKI